MTSKTEGDSKDIDRLCGWIVLDGYRPNSAEAMAMAKEIRKLREIEKTYERIRVIACNQSYDEECNDLFWPPEFTGDLYKAGILDILHPPRKGD